MDYEKLDTLIDDGEELLVTYRYPAVEEESSVTYHTRTDRLLAVEPSNGRVFVSFKGETPVWLEQDEVLSIEPSI